MVFVQQKRNSVAKSRAALEGRYMPLEPMIVYDVERLPNGEIHIHPPYLLKPDETASPL